ncbi:hypothetical protein D6_0166 [Aeromonas phage D6]|uniref:Uncharacterized protein n=1 Tax=Aeromonas phage D6 TaxID=2593322 RepID=A0A514TWC9_9CAUD|nr:hypothetical protein PQC08_gp109 [Aeromonas phage D6]QDJ97325.1 hypothetical protein D6_0166 [Aeromonas phage D6]
MENGLIVERSAFVRDPFWVSVQRFLAKRLADLEIDDPKGELEVARERYNNLKAEDVRIEPIQGDRESLVCITSRITGFGRVDIPVERLPFGEILTGMETNVKTVKTIGELHALFRSNNWDFEYVFYEPTGQYCLFLKTLKGEGGLREATSNIFFDRLDVSAEDAHPLSADYTMMVNDRSLLEPTPVAVFVYDENLDGGDGMVVKINPSRATGMENKTGVVAKFDIELVAHWQGIETMSPVVSIASDYKVPAGFRLELSNELSVTEHKTVATVYSEFEPYTGDEEVNDQFLGTLTVKVDFTRKDTEGSKSVTKSAEFTGGVDVDRLVIEQVAVVDAYTLTAKVKDTYTGEYVTGLSDKLKSETAEVKSVDGDVYTFTLKTETMGAQTHKWDIGLRKAETEVSIPKEVRPEIEFVYDEPAFGPVLNMVGRFRYVGGIVPYFTQRSNKFLPGTVGLEDNNNAGPGVITENGEVYHDITVIPQTPEKYEIELFCEAKIDDLEEMIPYSMKFSKEFDTTGDPVITFTQQTLTYDEKTQLVTYRVKVDNSESPNDPMIANVFPAIVGGTMRDAAVIENGFVTIVIIPDPDIEPIKISVKLSVVCSTPSTPFGTTNGDGTWVTVVSAVITPGKGVFDSPRAPTKVTWPYNAVLSDGKDIPAIDPKGMENIKGLVPESFSQPGWDVDLQSGTVSAELTAYGNDPVELTVDFEWVVHGTHERDGTVKTATAKFEAVFDNDLEINFTTTNTEFLLDRADPKLRWTLDATYSDDGSKVKDLTLLGLTNTVGLKPNGTHTLEKAGDFWTLTVDIVYPDLGDNVYSAKGEFKADDFKKPLFGDFTGTYTNSGEVEWEATDLGVKLMGDKIRHTVRINRIGSPNVHPGDAKFYDASSISGIAPDQGTPNQDYHPGTGVLYFDLVLKTGVIEPITYNARIEADGSLFTVSVKDLVLDLTATDVETTLNGLRIVRKVGLYLGDAAYTGDATLAYVSGENIAADPKFSFKEIDKSKGLWEVSADIIAPNDTIEKYALTVSATVPSGTSYAVAETTGTVKPDSWTLPDDGTGNTDPSITLQSLEVVGDKAIGIYKVRLADGSYPVAADFKIPFATATNVATPITKEDTSYDPVTGLAKFEATVTLDPSKDMTYAFVGSVILTPYVGKPELQFIDDVVVKVIRTPIKVTEAKLTVNGTIGTVSMQVRLSDDTIPEGATLVTPVTRAVNTKNGTKELTNRRYDVNTGTVYADIALENPSGEGTNYLVEGRVYADEYPNASESYTVETTAKSAYSIVWEKPVMTTKLITHSGKVVANDGSPAPTTVVVQPINGGTGLEGVNPVSQNYNAGTMTITYSVTAKEVTTVPVRYDYEGIVLVEDTEVPFRVTETVEPLTIYLLNKSYCNQELKFEYSFRDTKGVSSVDVAAKLTNFKISNGGNHPGFEAELVWKRKATEGEDRNVWVGTVAVPMHEDPRNRWDWTLEFNYPFENMTVTASRSDYHVLSDVNEGTAIFRNDPEYKQVNVPVGTRPVMAVSWLVDVRTKDGKIPLDGYFTGAISGSNTADNGKIQAQSYDPATGVITVVVHYYGNATAQTSVSAIGTIKLKSLCGFITPTVTRGSYILPKPKTFTTTTLGGKYDVDTNQLTVSFKVTPEGDAYPFNLRLKTPFSSAEKTVGGNRTPLSVDGELYKYDPATGEGSFVFEMNPLLDGEKIKFVTDIWADDGGIGKDTLFEAIVNPDRILIATHVSSTVDDATMAIVYDITNGDGSIPTEMMVKAFSSPSNIDGVATEEVYDDQTGRFSFKVGITKPTGTAALPVVINPVFKAGVKELTAPLTHTLYVHSVTQTNAGWQDYEKAFRVTHKVKRNAGDVDITEGYHVVTSADPESTGPIRTEKTGSATPNIFYLCYVPTTPPKTDDVTVYKVSGKFMANAGGKLFYALPWTCTFKQFLTNNGYVNTWLKDMELEGNLLTVTVNNAFAQGGVPKGTAYTNKPFDYVLNTLNGTKTPKSESYDPVTGILTFVFEMTDAFAKNGGQATFNSRVNFPAYGDNITKPALDSKMEVTKAVVPPAPVIYTPTKVSTVITNNELVETYKFANNDGAFPPDVKFVGEPVATGATISSTKPPVYDKTTGLFVVTYDCDAPSGATPVEVILEGTIDSGNEDGSTFKPHVTYQHVEHLVKSVNATLGANALVLDHEVTAGTVAIDNLVLNGVEYTNNAGTASLLDHTAGDKVWKLNLPRRTDIRPYKTTGTGNYSVDKGNKVKVIIPFTVDYSEPIVPSAGPVSQYHQVDLFSQKLKMDLTGTIPTSARITKFTPVKGFLDNVSNQLTQSYDPATGTLSWSAKTKILTGSWADKFEADMEITTNDGQIAKYKVDFVQNVFEMRDIGIEWKNGRLQRDYYVTLNGGYNFQGDGAFVALAVNPSATTGAVGTIHNKGEVSWIIDYNVAAPSTTQDTHYTGNGYLSLKQPDNLEVRLPWVLDYTNVLPKGPYVSTLDSVSVKDNVATMKYTLKNNTNDLPTEATVTKLDSAQGSKGGSLDVKSSAYDPATGVLTVQFDIEPIPVDLSMLVGCTAMVTTEAAAKTQISGSRRAWYYSANTTGYTWIGNNLKMSHNLVPGANSVMPRQATYVFGNMTGLIPGTNRYVCEHLNNESAYVTTYAVAAPDAAGTNYNGNGWIKVDGNAENAEVYVPFTISFSATSIPVKGARNVELYDISWGGGNVNFSMMCKEADGSFSPSVKLGPTVTRVYTPGRTDGAGVANETYDPATGILTATFPGAGPNATPSDFQLTGTYKYPNNETLDAVVNRALDNRAFGGGIHNK